MKHKVTDDMKRCMKSGDKETLSFARNLHASIRKKEIDDRVDLDDAGVIKLVQTSAKQRQDSIEQFRAGNRLDLVAKEEAELKYLQQFLPEQMGDEELRALVVRIAGTETDAGRLMRPVLAEIAGRADARRVSTFVREHCDNAKRH